MFVNEYELPALELADPGKVLSKAMLEIKLKETSNNENLDGAEEPATASGAPSMLFRESIERAEAVFLDISAGKSTISIFRLGSILFEFGLKLSDEDVEDIIAQLEMKDALDITFSEAIDIANYLASEY